MKLKPSYETEAYITVGGYYAIKQPDPMGGDEMVILLTRTQVAAIVKDMKECLDIVGKWGDEED
jgi:hypothetical protein